MRPTTYPNNIRTVIGTPIVSENDLVLNCDTSLAPVIINLLSIPVGHWSTVWTLYINDFSNNASVNNIIINAGVGQAINGGASIVINTNGGSVSIKISANDKYIGVGNFMSVVPPTTPSYQTIQDEGVALPQQPVLNFQGNGVVANNGTGKTDVTIEGAHIIADEGVALPQKPTLNFVGAGVTVTDNYLATTVTIPSGGHVIEDEGVALPQQPILDFQGSLVTVTDGGTKTIVTIGSATTVWNDIQNLPYYDYAAANANGIMPQYTIDGNKISLRGSLFIPLDGSATPNFITTGNSYINIPSAVTDVSGANMIEISNSNGNGVIGRQGRFFTADTSTSPNFPPSATPISRDISWTNVIATRRYSAFVGSPVVLYRSLVTLRICSNATGFFSAFGLGVGCLAVLAPYNEEVGGYNNSPLFGNDPLALLISRVTNGVNANNYIAGTDDAPFTIPNTGLNNPFTVDAHNANSLGGFVINLDGLTGFIN